MTAPLVVLGAGGKLGRLLAQLWPQGVVQLARRDLDILDTGALTNALRGTGAVLCLAGVTPGSDRPMSLNTTLAQLTLDAAARAGAGRVFLMSSAAVYGAQTGLLSEETPPAPLSPYGQAKLDMERMATSHPHPNTILRLGNVAGADAILGGWHDMFTLDCRDDGSTPRRSYIGPRKLTEVLMTLARQDRVPDLLNLSAPGSIFMGRLLDAAGLAWVPRPFSDQAIAEVTLDTTRLEKYVAFDTDDSTAAGIVSDWQGVRQ